jgi:hypothetical protein
MHTIKLVKISVNVCNFISCCLPNQHNQKFNNTIFLLLFYKIDKNIEFWVETLCTVHLLYISFAFSTLTTGYIHTVAISSILSIMNNHSILINLLWFGFASLATLECFGLEGDTIWTLHTFKMELFYHFLLVLIVVY